ncbi:hypothetical protein ACLMJK_001923 [Lecanora helva]
MASAQDSTSSVLPGAHPLRVAIVGGGIGGVVLAIGLLKHPHIDVHVYESAPSFGEIGAGVAIGPNAQRALDLIGPEASEAFWKHATPNLWPSHAGTYIEYVFGTIEHENEHIHAQKMDGGMQSVHRAIFLEELVKFVPQDRAHFNKRVERIDDKPDKEVALHFKDESVTLADAVIGADGVHSYVRGYLLGKEVSQPVWTGCIAYRGVVPMDAAVEKLGAEHAQNSMMLCGYGQSLISYPIDHGQLSNIVLVVYGLEHWEHEKSVVPAKRQVVEGRLQGWGNLAQGMVDLLDNPNLACWKIDRAPIAPYYNKNRVVMMGDAAHAMTPFQGQGAGQAMEDALVLVALLSKVTDPKQIPHAFAAFDLVRRPRTQKVMETSLEAGYLQGMMQEGVGDDIEKVRELMSTRMHWIWNRDLDAQNEEAIALFHERLS